QAEGDRQPGDHEQDEVDALARPVERVRGVDRAGRAEDGAHVRAPSPLDRRSSSSFDSASTTVVIRNRIRPSSISAAKYRSPTPPVNSLARAEAMLLPGAISEVDSRCALPITKVTAMVSPSARPSPSMTPPITPTLVKGRTTKRTTSQVVQPTP